MPAVDPGLSNAVSAAGPTEPVARLWETPVGGGPSAPILADETVFVGLDAGRVGALDARIGDRVWTRPLEHPAGRPWVVDEHLVVPVEGGLVALSTADGGHEWRVSTTNRAGLAVSPAGVFVLEAGPPTRVRALATGDGSPRWQTTIDDPWSAPVFVGGGRVFVSSGTHDVRFWTLDPDSGDRVGPAPRPGSDFPAEHFYRRGSVFAADAFFGTVRATSVTDYGRGWSRGVGAVGRAAMSGDDDLVYYAATNGDRPGLYALSTADGAVRWTAPVSTDPVFRPVVGTEAVLLRTGEELRALHPADGTTRWHRPADPFGDAVIVADDLLYTTAGGAVRAFRPP